jgi:hypothetical protein
VRVLLGAALKRIPRSSDRKLLDRVTTTNIKAKNVVI